MACSKKCYWYIAIETFISYYFLLCTFLSADFVFSLFALADSCFVDRHIMKFQWTSFTHDIMISTLVHKVKKRHNLVIRPWYSNFRWVCILCACMHARTCVSMSGYQWISCVLKFHTMCASIMTVHYLLKQCYKKYLCDFNGKGKCSKYWIESYYIERKSKTERIKKHAICIIFCKESQRHNYFWLQIHQLCIQ